MEEKGARIAGFRVGFADDEGAAVAEEGEGAPLRVLVVAQLSGDAEVPRAAYPISRATLDAVMGALSPRLRVEVPTAPGRERDLVFRRLKDLRPDALLAQCPELRAPAPPPAPSSLRNEARATDAIDALFDQVGMPGEEPPPSPRSAPRLVAESARPSALAEVIQSPPFRALESAWRGVKLMVDQVDGLAGVHLAVASRSAGALDAEAVAAALAAAHEAGFAPIDLVVTDAVFEAEAASAERLVACAEACAGELAVFVGVAAPSWLAQPSLDALSRSQRRFTAIGDPRSVVARSVAARDVSRWIALALNGPLVRAPYTRETSRLGRGEGDEEPSEAACVFAPASFAVAVAAARSQGRLGWPTALAEDLALVDLLVREVGDGPFRLASPLQVFLPSSTAEAVAQAGVLALESPRNRDVARFAAAPTLHRGPETGLEAPARGTVGDQLFTARVARAVQQIAAALPRETGDRELGEVVRIALAELFAPSAPPPGPEVRVQREGGKVVVTVRPRRFPGVALEEITLAAPLG